MNFVSLGRRLRRERAALERQRRRIKAEAEAPLMAPLKTNGWNLKISLEKGETSTQTTNFGGPCWFLGVQTCTAPMG